MLRISLDQWRALVAVVDAGGYAQAATQIHKSQSTVSYSVGQIELRLGVKIFEIAGRKAVLTAAGRLLYRRGRALIDEAERLESLAGALSKGEEAEIRLAVEAIFPTWLLLSCLAQLGNEHPEVRVELHETVLGGSEELLAQGQVDVAVCDRVPRGFVGDPLIQVRFIAVAAPSHALNSLGREISTEDLRRYRHLLVRDTGSRRERDEAWHVSQNRWIVGNKATSIRAALMGLGFAWYPEEIVRDELQHGELVPLRLARGAERWATLYLVYADPERAGPIAKLFGRMLKDAITEQLGRSAHLRSS